MKNTFRIRCLVALYHNAPEAMEAAIRHVPPGQGVDVVVVARSVRMDWATPEPFGDIERDYLPVRHIRFHAPPNYRQPEPDNLDVRAAYDRETNTIHLVSAE